MTALHSKLMPLFVFNSLFVGVAGILSSRYLLLSDRAAFLYESRLHGPVMAALAKNIIELGQALVLPLVFTLPQYQLTAVSHLSAHHLSAHLEATIAMPRLITPRMCVPHDRSRQCSRT